MEGFRQFVNLRGCWQKIVGWRVSGGRLIANAHYVLCLRILSSHFFLFLSIKISFFVLHFFFAMKYQIFTTEYWPFKNQNRWSEIGCGTACVIVVSLTSDEWVYLFVSSPKLILVSRFKSNWWAQQGFGTWPNHKAPGNLLVELVILLC